MTSSAIRSVLHNSLGTYTSRYSAFDGYWLFGFLVADLHDLRIDLLAVSAADSNHPLAVAVRSAIAHFEDQVHKAGLASPQIREAWLTIQTVSGPVEGSVNGYPSTGYRVSFVAAAVMQTGRQYERKLTVFVAPHNPQIELRSAAVASSRSS